MTSSGDNLSLVLVKKGEMRLEQRPTPEPKENEVLIAVNSVGICGSDVHYWVHGRIGDFVVNSPMILGHETSGKVIKVGSKVSHLFEGDRVALEVGIPCHVCGFCKNGKYNLCPEMKFAATPPVDGTLARYVVHDANFCYKLPDNVSYEEGAMLEPLAVGVSACRRGRVTMGENVMILGAGPIGLLAMLTAKANGIQKCVIIDIDESRLKFAKKCGADEILQINRGFEPDDIEKVIKLLGDRPDVTLECTGAESCITLGIRATKSGGRLILIGMGPEKVRIPLIDASVREIDIIGNFRYCNCYPTALALIASGKVDVKPLVTHRFTLDQSLEAFDVCRTCRDGAVKVMINCSLD